MRSCFNQRFPKKKERHFGAAPRQGKNKCTPPHKQTYQVDYDSALLLFSRSRMTGVTTTESATKNGSAAVLCERS